MRVLLLVSFFMVTVTGFAGAQTSYNMGGWVTWGGSESGELVLTVCPAGDGDYPSLMRDLQKNYVNGEIAVELWQLSPFRFLTPSDVPYEDVRLEVSYLYAGSYGPWYTLSHANTYSDGAYWFASPWKASGYAKVQLRVAAFRDGDLWESDILTNPSPTYHLISPDVIEGTSGSPEGFVNISDLAILADDYYGVAYNMRSDYAYDGVVDLSDIHYMSVHMYHKHPSFTARTAAPVLTPEAITEMILNPDHPVWRTFRPEDESTVGQLKAIFK